MPLPSNWSRPRAQALAATLLLHALVAAWLLSARSEPPPARIEQALPIWLSSVPPRLAPPPVEPVTITLAPVELPATPFLERLIESRYAAPAPDWVGDARDVARAFGGGPERRQFAPEPGEPQQLQSKQLPPTVFKRPLPRVGTTVTTPEGETILWVSDNCYITIGSTSLTMGDFHMARAGVRRCQIGLGRKEPRDNLFDHLRKPPLNEQQEPGCGPGDKRQSCAP